MNRSHYVWLTLVMALIVGGTFSPVLDAEFLYWDDDHNIYDNPRVQELSAENVAWMFTDVGPDIRYKPLTWLSWGLIDAMFGQSPKAFHSSNLILHIINTALLFVVIMQIGRRIRPASDENDAQHLAFLAGGVSLIWALHPLRVEPVAWSSCLAHGLCLFFCLLSVWSFLRTDFGSSVWTQLTYWGALIFFSMALLTFPLPLGFGAVFLALNIFPLRRALVGSFRDLWSRGNIRVYGELLPFLVVSVLTVVQQLYFRWHVQGTFGDAITMQEFPLVDRVTQAAYVWMHYLWKTVLPLEISPVYLVLTEYSGLDWPLLASLLALLGILFLALRCRDKWPGVLALTVAHLGVLVPVLGLTERPHFPGDRYSHLDGAILMAGLFGWLWWLGPKLRSQLAIGGAAVGLVFAALSFQQCLIWLDDRTFFTHQSEYLGPGSQRATALVRLGGTYFQEGDYERAEELYAEAYRAQPGYAYLDLFLPYGLLLENRGDKRAAARQYRNAIRIKPTHPSAWKQLGGILLNDGEVEIAAGLLRDAETYHANNVDLLLTFAEGFHAAGDTNRAVQLANRVAAIASQDPRLKFLRQRLP